LDGNNDTPSSSCASYIELRVGSMSRTAYVSRLRRAFLLRVHPDRFRDQNVRSQQATLVKALANRMSQSDFAAWLQQRTEPFHSQHHGSYLSQTTPYPFVMEKRDGSLLTSSISLDGSVDEILHSMSKVLIQSGAASLPTLPPVATNSNKSDQSLSSTFRIFPRSTPGFDAIRRGFDPRYNVQSNQGRDLKRMLQEGTLIDRIRERKAARVDAQATALQVRRLYQFAAVDATETQWSSASVAVLMRRLAALHQEFASQLHVSSFYPIRLVFSPREIPDDRSAALDIYGGILRLNPASTPIQWLEAMRLVTLDRIREIQAHRDAVAERTIAVQGSLGVKLKRGFTCSSRDYHTFLERLTSSPNVGNESTSSTIAIRNTSALPVLEPVLAIVEAEASCRRSKVTPDGSIQLGAGMTEAECRQSVARLLETAREKTIANSAVLIRCTEAAAVLQRHLGLQRVYRTGFVTHDEFLDCLSRFSALIQDNANDESSLLNCLAGNSLGIATTGHFCHLSDDGSLVIPHDWT
jgi:Domain of unknown function (DUF4461)